VNNTLIANGCEDLTTCVQITLLGDGYKTLSNWAKTLGA
jgi:hypothetical protein